MTRRGSLPIVGSVSLVMVIMGCQSAHETSVGDQKTPTPGSYATNSDGLTYGSSSDATSLETEPDLIFAYATNGKLGYVFKTDLEGPMPQNPEEAVAMQTARDRV